LNVRLSRAIFQKTDSADTKPVIFHILMFRDFGSAPAGSRIRRG